MRNLERVKAKTRLALMKATQSERNIREIEETDLTLLSQKVYNLSFNESIILSNLSAVALAVSELETTMNTLMPRIDAIENSLTSLSNITITLSESTQNIISSINSIEQQIETLSNSQTLIENNLNSLSNTVTALGEDSQSTITSINSIEQQIEIINNRLDALEEA